MNQIIIGLLFAIPLPVHSQTIEKVEVVLVKELTVQEMITASAKKYCVDEEIINKVIKCESSFNPKAVNWQDSHAKSKGSHGIAQFSRETLAHYSKQIGIENADPYNPQQAIETMAYMFSIKQGNHWSCYRKIKSL